MEAMMPSTTGRAVAGRSLPSPHLPTSRGRVGAHTAAGPPGQRRSSLTPTAPLKQPSRPQRRTARSALVASASAAVTPPFNVVITGGTKGVGRALAEAFIREGDNVALCSRSTERVAATVAELAALAADVGRGGKVVGQSVDVARPAEVAAFADFAAAELGFIDFWVNNAGSNGYAFRPLMDQSDEEVVSIVQTNVIGTMVGCREAIRVMRSQPLGGHVFNMDGAGADGGATPRFAAYGATKRSLEQLSKSLRAELKMARIPNVFVHNLSPGMVTTELLMAGADNLASKWFINCLAEEPATVAANLVPRMRNIPSLAATPVGRLLGGQYIRFLTKPKAYGQIFKKLLAGERKNRFVVEE